MSILRALRRTLVALRDSVDARLHARRLRRARIRLRALQPDAVVFVCLGNICRSPFAARLLSASPGELRVDSAGFIKPGRQPPSEALATALDHGIDHADHRSKVLTREMVSERTAVVIFDRKNRRMVRDALPDVGQRLFWMGDFEPDWSGKRAISDPWGRGDAAFTHAFARIRTAVESLSGALEGRGRASPDEVAEPRA